MRIIYYSLTGNVRKFLQKSGLPADEINPDLTVNEPFILVTCTVGFGAVPVEVNDFLDQNGRYLRGVSSSGNRNWEHFRKGSFARAADLISERFGVPVISKFELSGTQVDVQEFIKGVDLIESHGIECNSPPER